MYVGAALLLSPGVSWAATAPEPPVTTAVTGSLLEITRGLWQELQASLDTPAARAVKPTIVRSSSVPLTLTLGLYDEVAGTTQHVRVTQKGAKLTPLDTTPYQFKLKRNNGVNSELEVVGAPNVHVLALIRPILASIGTKRHPRFQVTNVAYVPYSDYLNRPEVVAAGAAYLKANVQAVLDELKALGVRSHAYPGVLLADAVSPAVVSSIIAIEHASTYALQQDAASYLSAFYVTLATNQNQSFAYAKSTAAARGLVQFIPSTYKRLVKSRPDLGLYADFERGMEDPYNAMKAEIGLLDANLATLPNEVRSRYEGDDATLGAYLAAIYNGGSTRVKRAIAAWGELWAQDQTKTLNSLKLELSSAKAELKAARRKLTSRTLSKNERAQLTAKVNRLTAKVSNLSATYSKGKTALLKRETVEYVAKFKLAYAYFAAVPEAAKVATVQADTHLQN